MLKTFQRSPVAPIKSAATIRCPVLEIGRNSVIPSTTPRMSAYTSAVSAIQKLAYRRPESLRAVGRVVAGTAQQDAALRRGPRCEQLFGMLRPNHVVALGDEAEQRLLHLWREPDRVEAMLEHPIDGKVPVVPLRNSGKTVVRRDEDHSAHRSVRRELHGHPASQAAAENEDSLNINGRKAGRVVVLRERVGHEGNL